MNCEVNYIDAHNPKYGEPISMPLKVANSETLKGYGKVFYDFERENVQIVPWPVQGWRQLIPGTGIQAGIRESQFRIKWKEGTCFFQGCGDREDEEFPIGRLPKGVDMGNRTHVLAREFNYHPDGSQAFYPRDGSPFVMPLGLPGDDIKPEQFVAFYFDGSFGLHIHPNVWHQAPLTIDNEGVFLTKNCAVHAQVEYDTVKDFGVYLKVPLTIESA